MAQSRSSRDLPLATIDAIAGVTPREWVTRHRPHMLNAQPIEPSKGHFEIVLDAFEVSGPSSRRSPQSVTGHRSSAGTVLVIHKDGRLRIGTVPLAVP
jgi:hypothetical protein